MDIIVFAVLTLLLFGMASLNKYYALIGLVAGIGLIMVALLVQTGDLQIQTGTIENVRTDLNLTNITAVYTDLSQIHVLGIESWLKTIISIVFGAAGLFIFIGTIVKIKI